MDQRARSVYDNIAELPLWYQAAALLTAPVLFVLRHDELNFIASAIHVSFGTTALWSEEYNAALQHSLSLAHRVGFAAAAVAAAGVVGLVLQRVRREQPRGCFAIPYRGVDAAFMVSLVAQAALAFASVTRGLPFNLSGGDSHAAYQLRVLGAVMEQTAVGLGLGVVAALSLRPGSKWKRMECLSGGIAAAHVVSYVITSVVAHHEAVAPGAASTLLLLLHRLASLPAMLASVAAPLVLHLATNHTRPPSNSEHAVDAVGTPQALRHALVRLLYAGLLFPAVGVAVWALSVGVYVFEFIVVGVVSTVAALWTPAVIMSSSIDAAAAMGGCVAAAMVVFWQWDTQLSLTAGFAVFTSFLAAAGVFQAVLVRVLGKRMAINVLVLVLAVAFSRWLAPALPAAADGSVATSHASHAQRSWTPRNIAIATSAITAVITLLCRGVRRSETARLSVYAAIGLVSFASALLISHAAGVSGDLALALRVVGGVAVIGVGMEHLELLTGHVERCLGAPAPLTVDGVAAGR